MLSDHCFLPLDVSYEAPPTFDFDEHMEVEHELWMLFPETENLRVNFVHMGLSAVLMVQSDSTSDELAPHEAYYPMVSKGKDGPYVAPMRMKVLRHMTLEEFRFANFSSLKSKDSMKPLIPLVSKLGKEIVGENFLDEVAAA
jgi:hypothetical protein